MNTASAQPTVPHVEIFVLRDGEGVAIARVDLLDRVAVASGDPGMVAELNEGIVDPMTGDAMFPSDGLAFMGALASVYATPYLYATDILGGV